MKTAQPRHLRTAPIVVIAALVLALTPTLSHAQIREGSLDPSFGNGGVSALSQVNASLSDVATYDAGPERGKLVAVGSTTVPVYGSATLLARFNANGSLDGSFGFGGIVVSLITSPPSAVVPTPDGGMLVLAGTVIARFTETGALDDGGGVAGAGFGTCGCGFAVGLPSVTGMVVARRGPGAGDILYTANATLDSGSMPHSFAYVGRLTSGGAPIWQRPVEMGPNPGAADDGLGDFADVIGEGPNGELIAAGRKGPFDDRRLVAVQLHSDGSFDGGFGTGGGGSFELFKTSADRSPVLKSVAVDSTGRAVIGGQENGPGLECAGWVARLTRGGALDGSFGSQGVRRLGGVPISEVAVDLKGRVLAGGSSYCRYPFTYDLGAVRLQASDGAFDPDFGVAGTAAVSPAHDQGNSGSGVALTDAGLVVAGRVDGSAALVRFFTAPEGGGGGGGGAAGAVGASGRTGRRAAALKKCKHKHRRARAKCKKKANRLPA